LGRAVYCLISIAALVYSQPVRQGGSPDLAATEASLTRAVKTSPSAQNWERLGLVRHLQNKYESAIPAFREAIRLSGNLWTSHLFLGICLYRTNQFEEALSSLERASRTAPKEGRGRDDVEFWLAASQVATGKRLEGLATVEHLLQRNRTHAEGLELSVRTAAELGTAEWNQVAESAFDTAPGYEVHGHALESEGNRASALEAFRRSKELAPERAGPGLAIGRLLLLDGKANEAWKVLQDEVRLAGCDPAAFYYAGLAAVQTGRYAEAKPWLEQAARWPSKNPEASLALAQVYLAVNEAEHAVTAAQQAAALQPASRAAHELLLSALRRAGLTAEADAEQRRWNSRR
jgi:tetratricopeptide (TPR) repeat protein